MRQKYKRDTNETGVKIILEKGDLWRKSTPTKDELPKVRVARYR